MDPPPSYDAAISSGPSTNTTGASSSNGSNSNSNSHKARNGIPPQSRRSMEDEARDLPHGWVRQFDPETHHQFFVDTTKDPPRSIWHHPYDDPTYMNSLSSDERSRISGLHRVPSEADIRAESSDEDDSRDHHGKQTGQSSHGSSGAGFANQPPARGSPPPTGIHKFGRRMKDKLTASTHEERERERQQRAEEEDRIYRQHQMYRAAMAKAMETGEPQKIGRDKQGRDVYIEPPYGYGGQPGPIGGGFGGMGFPGQGGYGHGAVGYNPYQQGIYGAPNSRYIRPQYPYSRPYGGGFGGGLGLPIGLGLGAGMLGGGLLGGGMMGGGMLF